MGCDRLWKIEKFDYNYELPEPLVVILSSVDNPQEYSMSRPDFVEKQKEE